MAETSIKITLDVADKAAQKAFENFVTSATKSDKALDHLRETGAEAFSEIGVHIGKATGLYDIFVGNLAANLAIKSFELLEEAAHKLFDLFVVDGVRAAIAQENAVNSLNVALANSGKYSKATSDEFVEFAEQLQKTSKFSNDAIIQNAALIQSLGHLDEDGLKRATQAAVDLAAGLGRDLPEASELVAKAAAGNVTALGKLGIAIQAGNTHAETFSRALRAIEERFSGSAAAQVNTYSGAVTQAANSFEDLTKQVGDLIVKNPVFVETIKAANQIFQEWTGAITSQHQALAILVGSGLVTFLETMAFVVSIVDVAARVFQTIYGVVQALSIPFLAVTVPIRALSVGLKQATEEMTEFAKDTASNLTSLGKTGDGALAGMAVKLQELRNAAETGFESVAAGANGTSAPLKNATGNVVELTEEMKKRREALKSFADELLKQADSAKTSTETQIQSARLEADSKLLIDQDQLNKKLINQVQFEQAKADIEARFDDARQTALQQQLTFDQDRILQALNQKIITETEYYRARNQLAAKFTQDELKLSADQTKKEIDNKKSIKEAEEVLYRQRVGALTDLTQLTNSKNRELFEIGKAASIAKIAVDTATGAIGAYSSLSSIPYVGPALGAAAAAALVAYGAEQAATVASTSFQYESGGIVPGTSFTGDNVVARVNSSEMILNRSQQAQLFDIANGRGSNGSQIDYQQMAAAFMAAISKQPVTVNVGGRTIVQTLREELAAGKTFA
jgi:hypothetical protein